MATNKDDLKKAEPKGTEDRSVLHDTDKEDQKGYPRPNQQDEQFDNQPEFIEKQPNRKDKEDKV